jgi:deoxyribose-phosphate aldolase
LALIYYCMQHIQLCHLRANTSLQHIEQLCALALQKNINHIIVPPLFIKKAVSLLQNNQVVIGTAIGFPYGYAAIEAKVAETVLAIVDGANSIELCINLGALKSNDWQYIAAELQHISTIVLNKQKSVSILLPVNDLTEKEILQCCDLYGIAGVNAIKIFKTDPLLPVDKKQIALVRNFLTNSIAVETLGSIKNGTFEQELINAGVTAMAIEADNLGLLNK